ncbi:MAG TPA: SpoIID/LytB domain-containing protein [Bryobacteraceae bacterium]|nr:SpoIID/LytB domain-containing protein [Bryobacteraceae bacterium]
MLELVLAATVKIGVFGLFHPKALEVRPAAGHAIIVEIDGRRDVIEGSAIARLTGAARVSGRNGDLADFVLSVPGKIQREFHGRLEVKRGARALEAIVEMDRETAVASIVGAEGSAATPFEAQKAQAVVARSFLMAARPGHRDFDFCDTTHCQFLREPAVESSGAYRAAAATRGLAIVYQGRVVAAMYSADCGGRTRAFEETEGAYPYFAVECPVKSNRVAGHRVGMCQVGAAELARRGVPFREILARYFPATTIERIGSLPE